MKDIMSTRDVELSAKAHNALADALLRVISALESLEIASFGRIDIEVVGDVMRIEVHPAAQSVDVVEDESSWMEVIIGGKAHNRVVAGYKNDASAAEPIPKLFPGESIIEMLDGTVHIVGGRNT